MRWNFKSPPNDPISAACSRVCSGFLFFPKNINGETRWLEFAVWVEMIHDGGSLDGLYWFPTAWRNK